MKDFEWVCNRMHVIWNHFEGLHEYFTGRESISLSSDIDAFCFFSFSYKISFPSFFLLKQN